VREVASGPESSIGAYRQWRPEAQERALEILQRRQARPWRPFYCKRPRCNGQPHVQALDKRECPGQYGHEWVHDGSWTCEKCQVSGRPVDDWLWRHGRWDQRPPRWHDDWLTWFLSGGRGSGKTRTGCECTHRATEHYGHLIFIAPTSSDFRETMVEGESGLLATAHPDRMPDFEPSKKKLTWPNGAVGLGFSAEEPERLRGKQSGFVWADEPAHYPDPSAVWTNMEFGHRLAGKNGAQPKVVATSTPKPTKFIKNLIDEEDTVTIRVSSYANSSNLADSYKRKVLDKHKGTRIGRQELYGEVLEDVEGALWNWDMFRWMPTAPALRRIVVAIDPAGTANRRSDETGIIVLGIGFDNVIYVLDDQSGKYSPGEWADRSVAAYEFWKADALVVEVTYGRDMVRHTLENSRVGKEVMPRIVPVDSRRGKQIRAEPIVAVYEKNETTLRIVHVGAQDGSLTKLEDEQTSWVPGESDSPNRVDALVHGATDLLKGTDSDVEFATPVNLPGSQFPQGNNGLYVPEQFAMQQETVNPYGLYIP
jgi:phage terminase large subunit-like protein